MNKIKQHIPDFVSDVIPKIEEFSTTEELLEIDFVKGWSEDKDFYEYALSENRLMAIIELENGIKWWVIGYIDNVENIDLPKWKQKRRGK